MIRQREEARQLVRVQFGELLRGHPFQERLGGFLVRAGGIHTHRDINVVADVAVFRAFGDGRLERAHFEREIHVTERPDIP